MRLRERTVAHFEENLDIRSLMRVNTNFSLALQLIFNKEQLLLFSHQYARTIPKNDTTEQGQKDGADGSKENFLKVFE